MPIPAENEVTQEEEPNILPAPKRRKIIRCRKCKKELHSDMMSCENPNCNTWLCNDTCLPKRYNDTCLPILKNSSIIFFSQVIQGVTIRRIDVKR